MLVETVTKFTRLIGVDVLWLGNITTLEKSKETPVVLFVEKYYLVQERYPAWNSLANMCVWGVGMRESGQEEGLTISHGNKPNNRPSLFGSIILRNFILKWAPKFPGREVQN